MTGSRREFLKGIGAAAVAAAGAPAIVSAQGRKGVPSDPVKIGVLAIRAGIAAPVGTAGLRGTEWWVERVNKAGGILGRKVQLVVEEESNPKDTVERYRKLVLQEKVEVVLGGISTGVTLALGPVAEDLATPWLTAAIKAALAGRRYEGVDWNALGVHCSETERRADEASRDVENWLKCQYMQEHVGSAFEGRVTGVTAFGLFVTLDDYFVDGLLHVSELGRDYFRYDAARHQLLGERTGRRYRLADPIRVKLVRVDLERRKIDFVPA